jgi:CubicO group peptidase (beta-lactamase class C family)
MTGLLDARTSDPLAQGLMQGFPPAQDKLVRVHDGSTMRFPSTRWSFSNQRNLLATARVWRGRGAPRALPLALRDDLDGVNFTTLDGRPMTWRQSLDEMFTDGILVLHRGRILQERYFGALDETTPHLAMSVTKSFVGLAAAGLVHDGALDPAKLVPHYIPELEGTAYGDATVRQVLDMTIGVKYSETYSDPSAEIWAYTAACGITPRPTGYTGPDSICDFLRTLKKEGAHGEVFAYKTCNTEVLGWIVQRVTGTPFPQLLSQNLWQQLGVEEDGYILVDRSGMPMCGGGLNVTLRDLARFGEMIRLEGRVDGRQVVPSAVVADITGGANRDHFARAGYQTIPNWSYRNQWWISHDNLGSYSARGIHGQVVWICPAAEMVVVRFASHPTAANANSALDIVSLPAWRALAEHLMRT